MPGPSPVISLVHEAAPSLAPSHEAKPVSLGLCVCFFFSFLLPANTCCSRAPQPRPQSGPVSNLGPSPCKCLAGWGNDLTQNQEVAARREGSFATLPPAHPPRLLFPSASPIGLTCPVPKAAGYSSHCHCRQEQNKNGKVF